MDKLFYDFALELQDDGAYRASHKQIGDSVSDRLRTRSAVAFRFEPFHLFSTCRLAHYGVLFKRG